MKFTHFMYCPWTGLGLYNGFRGNRWLRNRIKVFKSFVVPSLQAQTNKNFVLWCSWRPEERHNPLVKELVAYLDTITEFKTVHTFTGVCFYDDKYEDAEARDRLATAIHGASQTLVNYLGDVEAVYMTIQPSDDCYDKNAVQLIHNLFETGKFDAVGFKHGYIANYRTKEVHEYNPTTNPPFYTIRFSKENFTDSLRHMNWTAIKMDAGKYKAGTPLPSHEYVVNVFGSRYAVCDHRFFLVGCHGENISTTFTHPFKGGAVSPEVLKEFGIYDSQAVDIKVSWRKKLLSKLPHKVQRKIRYVFGERFWQKIYDYLRN